MDIVELTAEIVAKMIAELGVGESINFQTAETAPLIELLSEECVRQILNRRHELPDRSQMIDDATKVLMACFHLGQLTMVAPDGWELQIKEEDTDGRT